MRVADVRDPEDVDAVLGAGAVVEGVDDLPGLVAGARVDHGDRHAVAVLQKPLEAAAQHVGDAVVDHAEGQVGRGRGHGRKCATGHGVRRADYGDGGLRWLR